MRRLVHVCHGPAAAVVAVSAAIFAAACGAVSSPSSPTPTPVSYDGTWRVTVSVTSCYRYSNSTYVTVSGGAFSGILFTYCTNLMGVTRPEGTGCGTDIREVVSIEQGELGPSHSGINGGPGSLGISGNLWLRGDACNGGNGFYGGLTSSTAGTAASSWGELVFSR